MPRILIFGGTTEGRELAAFLDRENIPAFLSVASDYGREVLPDFSCIQVIQGRMEREEILAFLQREQISLVVDASHPYAQILSKNIDWALGEGKGENGISLLSLQREGMGPAKKEGILYVSSPAEAAGYLKTTQGNILLTTGSKDIQVFQELVSRIYARVLPEAASIAACKKAGIPSSRILAIQGPFSIDFNRIMLREYDCRFLVTKISGKNGGLGEKLEAAKKEKALVVAIPPPLKKEGLSLQECMLRIKEGYVG